MWHINTGNQCNIATTGAVPMTMTVLQLYYFFTGFSSLWTTTCVQSVEEEDRRTLVASRKIIKHNNSVSIRLTKPICTKDVVQIWRQDNVRCRGWVSQKLQCQTGAGDSTGSWLRSDEQSIEPEQSEAVRISSWKAVTTSAFRGFFAAFTSSFLCQLKLPLCDFANKKNVGGCKIHAEDSSSKPL